MRLTKRLLAMLLLVCMVLSLLPAIALTASAATLDNTARWTEVTWSQISDGDTIVIANTNNKALPNTTTSTNPAKVSVTVSGSAGSLTITPGSGTINSLAWDVKVQSGAGTSSMIAKLYQHDSTTVNLYLTGTSSNTALRVGTTTSNNTFTMGSGGKLLKVTTGTRYVGEYVSGSDWRTYNSETAANYSSQSLKFYKLNASAPATTYSVTVTQPSNGSITYSDTLTGLSANSTVTLTANPNTGYQLGSWNIQGAASTSTNGNSVTITMGSANVTATCSFTAKTQYTLTYNVNGTTTTESPSPYGGDSVTLPSSVATTPNGYTFVGWLASTYATSDTVPTGLLGPGAGYTMPNANTTLHAVFAQGDGGGGEFVLVESAPSDWSGDYVIANTNAAAYVMIADGSISGTTYSTSSAVKTLAAAGITYTAASKKLTNVSDDYVFTVSAATGGKYYIKLKGANTDLYLINNSTTGSSSVSTQTSADTTAEWTFEGLGSAGNAYLVGNAGRYLGWNSSYFRAYAASNKDTYQTYLFKSSGGGYTGYTTSPSAVATTYTLTYSASPAAGGSISCSYSSGADVAEDASVTLTATPSQHYSFTSWTVSGTSSYTENGNQLSFSMTDDITVTATFTAETQKTLTYSVNGDTTVISSVQAYAGDSVTLPSSATAPTGFAFIGWLASTYATSDTAPAGLLTGGASYTMPSSNTTLYAVFAEETTSSDGGFTLSYTYEDNNTTYYAGAYGSSIIAASTDPASAVTYYIEDDTYLYYMNGETKTYVNHNSSTSTNVSTSTSNPTAWTITESDGTIEFASTANAARHLSFNYNNANPRFNAVSGGSTYTLNKNAAVSYSGYTTSPVAAHTVTWHNGSEVYATTSVREGDTITAPAENPTKADNQETYYTFSGWSATSGGSVVNSYGTMGAANKDFYAVFNSATYSFTPSISGSASVRVGKTISLTSSLSVSPSKDVSGYTATWTSSDPTKATVSASGVVTGLAAGTVTITVSYTLLNGSTATATKTITVNAVSYTNTIGAVTGTYNSGTDTVTYAAADTTGSLNYTVRNNDNETASGSTFTLSGTPVWSIVGSDYGATINASTGALDFTGVNRASERTITVQVTGLTATTVTGSIATSVPADTITVVIARDTSIQQTLSAVNDTIVIDWALPVTFNVLTNDSANVDYTMTNTALPAGVTSNGNGSFTYTPTGWQTTDQTFNYTLSGTVNGSATTSTATVTLKTADAVYYEEGNGIFTFTGTWTNVSAGSPVSSLTDNADDIFGYETAYASYSTYSGGTAKQTTVTSEKTNLPSVSFTFAGTGFDVISATTINSGGVKLTVKDSSNQTATDPATGRKLNQIIDTFRGYSYEDTAVTRYGLKQVIRYKLENERYIAYTEDAVDALSNYTYYYDGETGAYVSNSTWYSGTPGVYADSASGFTQDPSGFCILITDSSYWVAGDSSSANYYQIPVIRITGLTYGTYTVTVSPMYSAAYDHAQDGSYDFIFDGVRIYNPVSGRSAEYKYISIRDAVAAGGAGSGTVTDHSFSAWVHNANSSPSSHTRTCTDCSETETALCSFTSAVTTEPTAGSAGVRTYTCSGCGYSYTESIPATGYTATFHVPSGATAPAAQTGASATMPAEVAAPAAFDAHEYTFAGWVEATVSDDTTAPATIHDVGDSVTLNANTDFYALYTYGGDADPEFVSSTDDVTEGTYAIVAKRSSGNFWIMTSDLGSASTKRYQATDSNVDTDADILDYSFTDAMKWEVEEGATSGTWYLKNVDTETYATWSSGNSGNLSSTAYALIVGTVTYNSVTGVVFKSNADNTRQIVLNSNSGNDYFAFYTGDNAGARLVKLGGEGPLTYTTSLSAAGAVTHDYAASILPTTLALHPSDTATVTATLTDGGATVTGVTPTYASSNTSVATVASDGTVTAVANGTANITATFTVDGDDYTATCAVTVTTLATYTVTYFVNGSQYRTETVTAGDSPSFTAPDYSVSSYTAHDYEFIGWKEDSALSDDTTTPQTIYTTVSTKPINSAKSFYAVYQYTTGGATTPVTELGNGASGSYVIAANVSNTYYAMPNSSFSGKPDGAEITYSGSGPISTTAASGYAVTFTKTSEGYTISNGTNLLGWSSSNTTNFAADTNTAWAITTGTHGSYRVMNIYTRDSTSTERCITYRAGSTNVFAPYARSNINGTEYFDVEIIPVSDGVTYFATTLNVASSHTYVATMSTATLTIEEGEESIAYGTLTDNGIVTNAYTPVYTSSNTSVATVGSNGYVTGVAAGSATITVTYTVNGTPYTATCAVTVTAAQTVTTYRVRYYVNGSLYNTETVTAGDSPAFDAPTTNVSAYNAQSYSFAGWVASEITTPASISPTLYDTNSTLAINADTDFYAAYTYTEGGSSGSTTKWAKATAVPEAGTEFIIVSGTAALQHGNRSSATTALPSSTVSFDANGYIITSTDNASTGITVADHTFVVSNESSVDYLKVGGGSSSYVHFNSSNKIGIAANTTNAKVTITKSGTQFTIKRTDATMYLSSSFTNSSSSSLLDLYVATTVGGGSGGTAYWTTVLLAGDGTTASLTVSPTSLSMTTGGYAEIAVTAANGGADSYVTATSGNNSVAAVYQLNDGANTLGVTAGSAGSTTITVRYYDSSATLLDTATVSVVVTAASSGGSVGTNANFGRVGSDGNAPTTSGNVNAGTRGVVATSISQKAADYYTDKGITWSTLTALAGNNSANSVTAASNNPLKSRLQTLMTLNNTVTYSSLTSYWPSTDKSGGSSNNLFIYSNVTSSSSVSREHVWPKSRGQFYESGAGSDIQHLRPEDSTINSTRSNHTMGYVKDVVSGYSTKDYGNNTVLWYKGSYTTNDCDGIVEVLDACKGDVARILLYVYTEYPENTNLFTKTSGGGSGNNASDGNKVIESRDTLLDWCKLDPVDTWEMSRNDACQNIQGNRNVYIDYPELAWMIFNLTPPSTMQTPSGQASVGNVGSRDTDTTTYRSASIINRTAAAMSSESAETEAAESNAAPAATRSVSAGSFTGAFMIDGRGAANTAADAEAYGPKYGVYIGPGQGIVFSLTSADTSIETQALQLGAKALNGAAGKIDVAAIGSENGSTTGIRYLRENLTITSATEMYYELDGSQVEWSDGKSSVILIYNSGTDVVAITNLRYPATNTLTMTVSPAQATRASRVIREVYGLPETDPDPINDAPALNFRSASLSLNSDIAINFYVDAAVYESIDAPYAVFTKALYNANGEITGYADATVSAATLTDYGYCFSFTGIRPDEMGSAVTAKLYGYRDGTLVEGDTCSYSVLSYVNRMANSSYADNADFRTLLADLVSYGAAAQTYTGYNAANLATAGVSAALLENATAAAPSLTNRTAFAPNAVESVRFVGAYLTLRDKVTVCYTIDAGGYDADALELLISYTDYDGTPKTVTISGEDFSEANGLYVASFSELNAVQMRTVLSAAVYANGDCVSSTLTYSIESYAQSKASGGDALAALVNAMMKFGDSAMTYFAE